MIMTGLARISYAILMRLSCSYAQLAMMDLDMWQKKERFETPLFFLFCD